MLVKLKNVRLAFPAIFEAKTFNGEGEPAYNGTFLFANTDAAYKEVSDALRAVAKEKWTAKADAMLKDLIAKDKVCLHDGNSKSDYDGFADMYYVSARNKSRPLVIDRDKSPLTQADGKPYAGCYVNVNLDIWPQENQFGKRINATLVGIQFAKDGDAFSGSAPATPDDFDSVEESDDLV
jgi:hypothetical protein